MRYWLSYDRGRHFQFRFSIMRYSTKLQRRHRARLIAAVGGAK